MHEELIESGQTASLEMHRILGPFEHSLWLVDRWTPLHFTLVVRIEGGSISVEDLNAALLQCQRRHPVLRTAIQLNRDEDPEFVPCPAAIPLRVVPRANSTQWLQEAEAQLALPFERGEGPLLRASLVQGKAISELILTVHHSIGDGVSAMHFVRDMLETMEGHSLGELPPRPALETLLGGEATSPTSQPQRPAVNSSGLSRFDRPQRAFHQVFAIGPDELARILARCRQEGITFQGALLAALLLSLPGQETLRCLAPVNLRKLFPILSGDFGLYISSGMITLDRNDLPDFWSLARSARQQVMQAFDPHALSARATATASVTAGKPNPQTAYESVWRTVGYNAVLTNFGRLPDIPKLRRFRVTAAYPILNADSEPVIAVATVNQHAYLTFSSLPALAWIATRFLSELRQHTS